METTSYSHSETKTEKITIVFQKSFPNQIVLFFNVESNGEVYFSSAIVDDQYESSPNKIYPYIRNQTIVANMDQIVLNHAKDVVFRSQNLTDVFDFFMNFER